MTGILLTADVASGRAEGLGTARHILIRGVWGPVGQDECDVIVAKKGRPKAQAGIQAALETRKKST